MPETYSFDEVDAPTKYAWDEVDHNESPERAAKRASLKLQMQDARIMGGGIEMGRNLLEGITLGTHVVSRMNPVRTVLDAPIDIGTSTGLLPPDYPTPYKYLTEHPPISPEQAKPIVRALLHPSETLMNEIPSSTPASEGVEKSLSKMVSGVTSVPVLAEAMLGGKAVIPKFQIEMASQIPEIANRMSEAASQWDVSGVAEATGDLTAASILPPVMARAQQTPSRIAPTIPQADIPGSVIDIMQPRPIQAPRIEPVTIERSTPAQAKSIRREAARETAFEPAPLPAPEVPNAPAPEQRIPVLQEIRAAGARTKAEIQKLFPKRELTREEAADLRRQAWPDEAAATKGELNAVQPESAQLLSDVRPQPVEGAGQVPTESGGPPVGERGSQASTKPPTGTPKGVAKETQLPLTDAERAVEQSRIEEPPPTPEPEWMGKPISQWEAVDTKKLSASERAALSKSLAVENKPAAITKKIAERTSEIRKNQGLAKDVRAKLEQGGNRGEAGFVNLDVLKQVVDYGKALWSKGMEFADWSKDMISHLGEKAAAYLSKAWNALTETKPVESVTKFTDEVLAGKAFSTEQANAIGLQVKSLADLDHLLDTRKKLGERMSEYLRKSGDLTLTDEERTAALNEGVLASTRNQIPREAIETAINAGSHVKGEGTPTGKELGERPLDWRKNENVAQWLRTHAQEAGIKLPDELKTAEGKSGLAKDVRAAQAGKAVAGTPAPALNTQSGFFSLEPLEKVATGVHDWWRSFSMQSLPKITAANREVGEAGVRYETAPRVARAKGIDFAERVLGDDQPKEFDTKLGTALTEDNLRGIKEGLRTQSVQELAKGNVKEANRLQAAADKVASLVGRKNSPFKTEAEYQDFLKNSKTQEAIDRHIQQWEAEKDPLFRKANDLNPDAELASRGLQTGARVNLKNVVGEEGTPTTVGPASRPTLIRQTATLLRNDPFRRQAKGTGQSYEGSYREIMANGFEREYPVAMQHDFIRQLIESGEATLTNKEFPKDFEIKGEKVKGYLMKLRPWAGQFLQIRKSLAPEYESISGLTPAVKIPYYSKAADFLTRQSIMGLAEGSTHIANIGTQLFTGVGPTANPMLNALLKTTGRADLLYSVPKMLVAAFADRKTDMLRLAEIGAAKEPYKGTIGWVINKVDQGTRLYASDLYRKMAKDGWVEDTETGEREFVNQVGQYAKRLQPTLIRVLRDTGTQPFATAMHTFNVQGLRNMAMGPGAKAPSNLAAIALRADKAAGIIGTIVLITALNKLVSGTATGPPGTALGSVGWIGDDKKLHQFNVGKLTGWERGPRITGTKAAVEARRLGLSPNTALTAAGKDVAGSALNYVAGPAVQFATKAMTGQRPGVPMVQEAKIVPPNDTLAPMKSQAAENLKTALQEINPVVDTAVRVAQGKPTHEIIQSQLSRYTPRTGMDQQTIAALPKIVHSSELHSYVDALAKEARKLEPAKRTSFLMKRLKEDGLKGEDFGRTQLELHRKGVL